MTLTTSMTSDDAGHADKAAAAIAALEFIAKSLAEDPEAVSVEVSERQGKVILSLSVGRVIWAGSSDGAGAPRKAIRALVGAVGSRDGVTTSVDIVD